MNKAAELTEEQRDGGTVIRLSGNLAIACLHDLPARLDAVQGPVDAIDLSQVDHIDTIGAWTVHSAAKRLDAKIIGADGDAQRLVEAVGALDEPMAVRPDKVSPFTRVVGQIGDAVISAGTTLVGLLGFFGASLVAAWGLIRHPSRFRVNAVVQRFEVVGVSALGIIGLMSFLIGIVIAQQGSVQLRQFGMEMLTINLVGRLTFRELGVLMTAIMVAGRSGSAFAAQLGTMKLTEEIDAMRTIGIAPMEALVIPRIMAAVLMMPLLGFYASCMAIIGGAVVGELMLGIPFWTFLSRIQDVVPTYDVWVGLLKAPVFGLIVALAGCYNGMQVKGNSEEVGRRTTLSVVAAIFAVIVLDAFFAVFFTKVGWA
ncbi:ABC transporter permease [Sphingobium abikonense]|uniref:ABC transporter permease n=1 Tax=Sphingobium abikonense TaxID=86193 RepID=UPI0035199102